MREVASVRSVYENEIPNAIAVGQRIAIPRDHHRVARLIAA